MQQFKSVTHNLQKNMKTIRLRANAEILFKEFKINAEATSDSPKLFAGNYLNNGFANAVHAAYDDEYGLIISPDNIWLTIVQGFARHILQNSEKYRYQFVSHEGQKLITVERNDFIKGSKTNDWSGVFEEFSERLETFIGKKRDLIVSNFSTTGPIEKAASQIVLMDVVKNYFKYRVMTKCGIPEIRLEGTIDDWKSIKTRVAIFKEFDLGWWVDLLEPVLDQFILASEGKADPEFWQNIYKHVDFGSGGPTVTGWIWTLFPYILNYKNDLIINITHSSYLPSHSTSSFPTGISQVPFLWEYYGTEIKMHFNAGHIGYTQTEDKFIKPVIAWAISEDKNK